MYKNCFSGIFVVIAFLDIVSNHFHRQHRRRRNHHHRHQQHLLLRTFLSPAASHPFLLPSSGLSLLSLYCSLRLLSSFLSSCPAALFFKLFFFRSITIIFFYSHRSSAAMKCIGIEKMSSSINVLRL